MHCRRLLLIFAIAMLSLVGVSPALAQEVRGVILEVTPGEKQFRLEGRGAARRTELAITWDEQTVVLFGNDKREVADLANGQRVRVQMAERDGRVVAAVIRVAGPAPERVAKPEAKPTDAKPTELPADALTGTLQRVALADREIVLIGKDRKGADSEITVAVPDTAKILKDGKPIILAMLREGETVVVRTEDRGGQRIAVEIQSGATVATAAPPAQPQPERGRLLPRLRRALRIADEVLRGIEERRDPGPEDRP